MPRRSVVPRRPRPAMPRRSKRVDLSTLPSFLFQHLLAAWLCASGFESAAVSLVAMDVHVALACGSHCRRAFAPSFEVDNITALT